MAVLALTPVQMPLKYPVLPPAANSLDVAFIAAGASFADGAEFTLTGREVVLVYGGAAGGTISIDSVPDGNNREGDITAYAIGATEYALLPRFQLPGWAQTNGKLHMTASAATITFLVIHLDD